MATESTFDLWRNTTWWTPDPTNATLAINNVSRLATKACVRVWFNQFAFASAVFLVWVVRRGRMILRRCIKTLIYKHSFCSLKMALLRSAAKKYIAATTAQAIGFSNSHANLFCKGPRTLRTQSPNLSFVSSQTSCSAANTPFRLRHYSKVESECLRAEARARGSSFSPIW